VPQDINHKNNYTIKSENEATKEKVSVLVAGGSEKEMQKIRYRPANCSKPSDRQPETP